MTPDARSDLREIAGVLATFWAGGSGPSHSSLGTALAIAGYDEPSDHQNLNKQQRVLSALRRADAETARRVISELVSSLMIDVNAHSESSPAVARLSLALQRAGGSLTEGGAVTWDEHNGHASGSDAAAPQTFDAALSQSSKTSSALAESGPVSSRRVMVVYGRDEEARKAVFGCLRALGLEPVEWEQAVAATAQASPYTKQTVEAAFSISQAVLVILTPDDQVVLHPSLAPRRDQAPENRVEMQARPNVYIELGMALAIYPERTLIIELGGLRRASDLEGLNVIRLRPDAESIHKLANRLQNCGCPVDRSGTDWLDTASLAGLAAFARAADTARSLDVVESQLLGAQDQALFELFLDSVPSSGSIGYLRNLNFNSAFQQDRLNQIDDFVRGWDDAEHTFFDAEMERLSTEFYRSCVEYRSTIGLKTWPHDNLDGWYGVPSDWEETQPERFVETVALLEGKADAVVKAHQALVLEGRRRTPPR